MADISDELTFRIYEAGPHLLVECMEHQLARVPNSAQGRDAARAAVLAQICDYFDRLEGRVQNRIGI